MKMKTAWWGCQILAETTEDKEVLEKLLESLPKENIDGYEEGNIEIINEGSIEWDQFSIKEVKQFPLVIEINR
jgi:hypothetical protein